jgi:hypothetical protein
LTKIKARYALAGDLQYRNYHAILMVAVWFVLVPICIITVSVRYDSA